jgi:uncharacterized protein
MPLLIDDLLNPESLPDPTSTVALVQTHISLVFVAEDYVYKVKKPVNFGFLDFTTLEKRRHFCEEEVRLNRRLSKGMYLGVVPIMWDGCHHRIDGGSGDVVEYAVKMRRIPDAMLMKSVFQRGELREDHLKRIARVLARFATQAETSIEIEKFGEPDRFRINTDENFAQTAKYVGKTIDARDYDSLRSWTDRFYVERHAVFFERIRAGKVRDCHGDLHMEHICLTEEIAIFDCIEFNDRFRYSDTVSDIAFLLMDLEFYGGEDLARYLWDAYREMAHEIDVEALLTFYKVYRAYVRGKVNSFQLDDDQISPEKRDEAAQRAAKYFRLALSYSART